MDWPLRLAVERCAPRLLRTAALLGLLAAGALLAAPSQTNPPPAALPVPKSVFLTNDASGVDPFFPKSTRLKSRQNGDDGKKATRALGVGALQLKGIMGPPEKRIALINNLTFAKGEEAEVRVSDGKLKIKCVDIRPKSAVVTIDGQAEEHELVLPEKTLPQPE